MFRFRLLQTSGKARLGEIKTSHGKINTPVFMPVGTLATVKSLTPDDIHKVEAEIILANAYHLHLRPGEKIIKKAGGLHKFMSWNKPMLTDSGGFQVFSLSSLRQISDRGVKFKSHLDGKQIFLTPESAIKIQEDLGADIIMALDDVVASDVNKKRTKEAMDRTHSWLKRCIKSHADTNQALFGIIQGGMFADLRVESTKFVSNANVSGIAIGGLSIGESRSTMYKMLDIVEPVIPKNKPRYLMGVGDPVDLLESIDRGIDMFDCVLPTRLARHGTIWTYKGKINILNSKFKSIFKPIDSKCTCYACQNFTSAYIHHLLKEKEILGMRLTTMHNLHFLLQLMKDVRHHIKQNTFASFKKKFIKTFKKQ